PVVFGPEYEKYVEAAELINTEGGFSVENALELEQVFDELIKEESKYEVTCTKAWDYVKNKSGATDKIVSFIYEKRLLTNVSNN
ncbi:hypothetical protein ABTJ80_20395, partial [Acinetobacter baumannii]